MNAVTKIISCAILLILSALSYGFYNVQSDHPLTVHFKYDIPINNYVVNGVFYPFEDQSETGQVTLRFTSIVGGQDFIYSNVGQTEDNCSECPAKFSGYNICEYVFADDNTRSHDGDTLLFHYNADTGALKDSPLFYYAEFQFFDVDFDGEEEFLVNDYCRGKGGNNYAVYEITNKGLMKKEFKPFDRITNATIFDGGRKVITDVIQDGVFYSEYTEYKIAPDGNSAIVISHKEVVQNP